jgi:hypothetical protein
MDFVVVQSSEFFKHVQPYFNDVLEMRHYEITNINQTKGVHAA